MTIKSHIWVGFLSGLGFSKINFLHISSIKPMQVVVVALILAGSVFPDFDLTLSGFKRENFKKRTIFSHRGISHHFAIPVLLTIIALSVGPELRIVVSAFTMGVTLHILTDMFSPLGVMFGSRYQDRVSIPLYKTKTPSETVFVGVVSLIIVAVFFAKAVYAGNYPVVINKKLRQKIEELNQYNAKLNKDNFTMKTVIDNLTVRRRAFSAAKNSVNYFRENRRREVENQISALERQYHVDINKILPHKFGKQLLGENNYIYIFMSSSVPMPIWHRYVFAIDKLRRNGQGNIGIVLRGFVGGLKHYKETLGFIMQALKYKGMRLKSPILIDPLLFRLYKIKRVPVFVYAKNVKLTNPTSSMGISFNLKGKVTAYKVIGDCSLDHALGKLYEKSGDGALLELKNILEENWFEKPQK